MSSHDEIRAALHHAVGAAALFDATGRLVHANPEFGRVVGGRVRASDGFAELFGDTPARLAEQAEETFRLDGRHYAVTLRPSTADDWLCQLTDVTALVERQEAAHVLAERDPLTDLPNRRALMPEIERALSQRLRTGAVLMIDLDRFKSVNDTLGHGVGDALLRKVADRLRSSIRDTDQIARLGGDEFAILQLDCDQPDGAATLARRLVEVVGRAYLIDDHMVDIGCSVGVALVRGGEAVDADTLVKHADMALNRAKQAGRGRFTFFEQAMDDAMQQRRAMEQDLRRALAFRQFELLYQPQIDLVDEGVTGMEALIRWNHPQLGQVQPGDFIPLAEETGLIVPIGEWVLRQACADARRWPDDVAVCVNVSARQLSSDKLVATVAGALAHAGIAPQRLEVEVTESVLMSDLPHCMETLHGLRDLGVRIAMDDFGTGYSSLSHLSSFPFDKIKIDQSFVRTGDRARNDGIVRAITAIGRHLGMQTIAEGVETEEQLREIGLSGCGSAQGYLISPPVPIGETLAIGRGHRAERATDAPPAAPEAGLYRLVYHSRNAILGLEEEVEGSVRQILDTSRRNNAVDGVTGALMFTDGLFAQILEGQRGQVERVFDRIQLDDRHTDVTLLSFEPVERRDFPTWTMAFVGRGGAHAACAAESGFNPAVASGNAMAEHLRILLDEEERFAIPQAA